MRLKKSYGTNHVINGHEYLSYVAQMKYSPRKYDCTTILNVQWIKINPFGIIISTSSSGTNYVLNNMKSMTNDQYGPQAITPKLALLISLESMRISTEMIHMHYHPI